MLTSEEAIVVFSRDRAYPDRLGRKTHAHYIRYAERMLALYGSGAGRTRRELHRAVEAVFAAEPDCESRRIQAFCKLLDDAGDYETDREGRAAELRLRVFALVAPCHPLVARPDRLFEKSVAEVREAVAGEIGRPWNEIENDFYADVIEHQRLKAFHGYPEPAALLSRYNVAQVQACLYRAESMTIEAAADFRTILRCVKLSRLLHEIQQLDASRYRIIVSGPASVLHRTRRYGVNMARFLPALLACTGWTMRADIHTPWGRTARLELSDRDGLRSHVRPRAAFDSALEEKFAARFGDKRDGWTLVREGEIVHHGQHAFLPDFVFRHDDGTEVLFEIVGFWTPQYLERKRRTLRTFKSRRILLAVPAASATEAAHSRDDVVVYKSSLTLEPVLAALERFRG